MKKLSDAVRETMARKGWNADRLAEEAGLARSTVFNVLADKEVDLTTLRKLDAVGVAVPVAALLSA